MNKYPKSLQQLVHRVAKKHKTDIDAAVKEARTAMKQLPDHGKKMEELLIVQGLREMILDSRHSTNRRIRRNAQQTIPVPKTKVKMGQSTTMRTVYNKWFDYRIGATVLGDLKGHDLPRIASEERAKAGGHIANAELCEALSPMVAKNQTVRQALTATKLARIASRYLKAA